MGEKKRDPAVDVDASFADLAKRLMHMGYPGNVRVEFPLYTVEDVKWVATLVDAAARALVQLHKEIGANDRREGPLKFLCAARSIVVDMDKKMKQRCTSAEAVRKVRREVANG